MVPVVAEHADELEALCRRYSVLRLDLFGSAATGAYRQGESDLDFVVEFLPDDDGDLFGHLLWIAEGIGTAFQGAGGLGGWVCYSQSLFPADS